jgi:hypothetical protein
MKLSDVNFSGFDCTISAVSRSTVVVSNPKQDFWLYIRHDAAEITRGLDFFADPDRHFSARLPSGRTLTVKNGKILFEGTSESIVGTLKRQALGLIDDLLTSRSNKQ